MGQIGGHLDPDTIAALIAGGAAAREALLSMSEWPIDFDEPRPTGDDLHPVEVRGPATFVPIVVHHRPHTRSAWLEPIQPFVLYWDLWPQHEEYNVTWFEDDDDGLPVEVARFRFNGLDGRFTRGTLEIRRDRLLAFCARFDFDLAVFDAQNIEAPDLDEDWREEERTDDRHWRAWAYDVSTRRAVFRCVTLIEHPPLDQTRQPWDDEEVEEPLRYPVGHDNAGNVVYGSFPPDEFLTPVFFRRDVLDRYYANPTVFTIEASQVSGGRWSLPIAETEAGTIQAYLGDVADLPVSVQGHWYAHAIPPEGQVPEWRVRTDFLGEFVAIPEPGPIGAVKRAVAAANSAAEARYGVPLFRRELDAVHAETIEALRVPSNNSMDAFVEEVRALALPRAEPMRAHCPGDGLARADGDRAARQGDTADEPAPGGDRDPPPRARREHSGRCLRLLSRQDARHALPREVPLWRGTRHDRGRRSGRGRRSVHHRPRGIPACRRGAEGGGRRRVRAVPLGSARGDRHDVPRGSVG